MRRLALALIRVYQTAISPLIPSSCRYLPSCSNYGYESIARYGALKGGWMALKRVARCHPLRSGGYDPVP